MLLKTETKRIALRDLPRSLEISETDWLFECYDAPLHYSKGRQALIPEPEHERTLENLRLRAQETLVDLPSFAGEWDVSLDCMAEAARNEDALQCFTTDVASGSISVGSHELVDVTKQSISSIIAENQNEKIDLSGVFPTVPQVVLEQLAYEVARHSPDTLHKSSNVQKLDGSVIFIPHNWITSQAEKQRTSHEYFVASFVRLLETAGFCQLALPPGSDPVHGDVSSSYKAKYPEAALKVLHTEEGVEAIVVNRLFAETLEQMNSEVARLASEPRHRGGLINSSDTQATLVEKVAQLESSMQEWSKRDLTRILLRTEYVHNVDATLTAAIVEIDREHLERFEEIFQTEVMAPVSLYAVGLVNDVTLRGHQEEFLGTHFRDGIIPQSISTARKEEVLHPSIAKNRDVDKFLQNLAQTKTLSAVQSILTKFIKKHKIPPPSPTQLIQVKKQSLRNCLRAMDKMIRGSDVLQTLTWILLASKSEGLYMSAGKDTSRMIRQYQLVGDEGTSRKLQEWRDEVKGAQVDEKGLSDMREMARMVVERIDGDVEAIGDS